MGKDMFGPPAWQGSGAASGDYATRRLPGSEKFQGAWKAAIYPFPDLWRQISGQGRAHLRQEELELVAAVASKGVHQLFGFGIRLEHNGADMFAGGYDAPVAAGEGFNFVTDMVNRYRVLLQIRIAKGKLVKGHGFRRNK